MIVTKLYFKNEEKTLEDSLQLDMESEVTDSLQLEWESEVTDSSTRHLTPGSSIWIGQGKTMRTNFGLKMTICLERTQPEMRNSMFCLTNWIGLQRTYLTAETMII